MTPTVAVGICTFKRNGQLTVLLDTLLALAQGPLAGRLVAVVVVDDDPQGGAEPVVAAAEQRLPGRVHYRRAGSANLSIARNTVIETGLDLAEWLVFIDDDCLPDPAWLDHLLDVQQRTGATMVTGHVVYRVRDGASRWLVDEPFCDYTSYEDEQEPAFGNTANVLLSTQFLRESGVRFRPTLGRTGGEDMTFYTDARARGAVLRYSARSNVFEELTPSRERLGYHLHRQFWLGNNMVVINRHVHVEPMLRMLVRGVKRFLTAPFTPLVRLSRGEAPQVRWALAVALQGLGLVLGVLGVTVKHRP